MLSLANIKSTQAAVSYFEKDNYYSLNDSEQKSNSEWFGKGAKELNLKGEVKDKDFENVLNGKLPSGQELGRKENGKIIHAPGIDMTFSAPKSVSIQAEVYGDKRIYKAHRDAVLKTLSVVQDRSVSTRKMVDGKIVNEQVNNITAALFKHDTSRDLDPQLHTHSIIANVIKRADGTWRSADFSEVFNDKILLGQIYRTELAQSLQELGYDIKVTGAKSLFELKHIPDSLISVFSTRRQEIEKAAKGYQSLNAKLMAHLAKVTRSHKKEASLTEARSRWKETAKEHEIIKSNDRETVSNDLLSGSTIKNISQYVKTNLEKFIARFDVSDKHYDTDESRDKNKSVESASIDYALRCVSNRSSIWHERELLSHALSYSTGKSNIDSLTKEMSKYIKKGIILESKDPELRGQKIYSYNETLKLEKSTIELMLSGKEQTIKILSKDKIQNHLKETHLNKGQKDAVELILSSKDRVIGVQGFAGTGKTTMLKPAKKLLEGQELKFMGLAPSASAVSNLETETGIKSQTLQKLLYKYDGVANDRYTSKGLASMQSDMHGIVTIVDEASLASTREIHDLLKISKLLDFKVVLIGDHKQLDGVEAGTPFKQLQKAGMETALMNQIVRQKDSPKLLQAVYDTTRGNIKAALAKIENNIVEHKIKTNSREEQQIALANNAANEWLSLSKADRENTLLTAPSHVIRNQINKEVRERLKFEGELSGSDLKHTVYQSKDLTPSEKQQTFNYKVDDRIIFNRDFKKLSINQGDSATVTKVGEKSISVKIGKKEVEFDPSKIKGQNSFDLFTQKSISIQSGEKLMWTRNTDRYFAINTKEVCFNGEKNGKLYFKDHEGTEKSFDKKDPAIKHLDYAYCYTVHASQGKTVNQVIGVIEASHPHLTNQKSFYVTISRARNKAILITDDKAKLSQILQQQTGVQVSSIEHQTEKNKDNLQKEKPTVLQAPNYQRYDIKDIYYSMYPKLPQILSQFGFKNCGNYYVSTTGHKVDGSSGKASKVYVYQNNPGTLVDYTRGNKSIYDYIKESSMPSADKAEMMKYLTDVSGLSSFSQDIKTMRKEFAKLSPEAPVANENKVDTRLLSDIHSFSVKNLDSDKSKPVLEYLHKFRGYESEIIRKMELGCLTSKKDLGQHLKHLGWPDDKIKEAYKLLNNIGKTHNLVIPFKDDKGQIIGFAGRNINYQSDDKLGKYLYTKGLSRTRQLLNSQNLVKGKPAVIVEGMLDSLHAQARGIKNIISLGGTAFNKHQLNLLEGKGVKEISLCLDNDKAGKEASDKIAATIKSNNPSVTVNNVILPINIKDPDQMIREKGSSSFEKCIANSDIIHKQTEPTTKEIDRVKDEEFTI